MRQKNAKGEVSVFNADGRIRLRWRVNGEPYSLSTGFAYTPENLVHAHITAGKIKSDILSENFDCTLESYKAIPKIVKKLPDEKILLISLIEKLNEWGEKILLHPNIENNTHHIRLRSLLMKAGDLTVPQAADLLGNRPWNAETYNARLGKLKNFFGWLYDVGEISCNPLKNAIYKRTKRKKSPKRIPLKPEEIIMVLEAIRNDTFCSKKAPFRHSHYYPFLAFLFRTGVRNAEAIGLRVKHVHLDKGYVKICEVMARTSKGASSRQRVRKGTKNGSERELPLTDDLRAILSKQIEGKEPEDLVFPSPQNKCIDDCHFPRRVFKPVLRKLGIEERTLYVARHGFGTAAIDEGISPTETAYLMGNSPRTVWRNYVDSRQTIRLPEIIKFTH